MSETRPEGQPMNGQRYVCHFSCGAASAVATKLALAAFQNVLVVNAFVLEEESDNRRFLADCEKWFGHAVIVVRDEKYGASAREVWKRKRFIKSALGAPCSIALKREPIEAICKPDDKHIYGFTADEAYKERVKRFLGVGGICPLIERSLTHADCLAIVERAGIQVPLRYRQGFNNANCICCCKGGEGYFNRERELNPRDFIAVAEIEKSLGPSAFLFRDRKTGERFSLYDLPAESKSHKVEAPDCSLFCEEVVNELEQERR